MVVDPAGTAPGPPASREETHDRLAASDADATPVDPHAPAGGEGADGSPAEDTAGAPAEAHAAAGEPTDRSAWHLTAVVQAGDGARALINGLYVKPGGMVDGARVIEIGPTWVELERDGRRFLIRM